LTRILATGESGTIGSFLPQEVLALDFRGDTFKSEIKQLIENEPFSIIHLAGIVGESLVQKSLDESWYVNVEKTAKLADFCLSGKLKKFFYISTSHVYSKSDNPISEQTRLGPMSAYSAQKLEAEIELTKIFQQCPHKLCILRVFSVLSLESRDYTLGAAINRAAADAEFKISNIDDERDFLHPRQISEIIIKLLCLEDLPQVINICSGTAMSVREAIQILAKHKNLKINPDQLTPGKSENPRIVGDATLLKSIIKLDRLEYKCFD
jgi:nucleoside-diphosphate-sugar epimerase